MTDETKTPQELEAAGSECSAGLGQPLTLGKLHSLKESLEKNLAKTIKECQEEEVDVIWLSLYERRREFNQMIELVSQFIKTLEAA